MRKILSLLVAMVFVLGAVTLASTAEMNKGAEKYTIDKCQKRKGPVEFNHWQHQKIKGVTCKTCHHKEKEGETPKACFQCHQCKPGNAPKAMMAFHKTCKGCHAKMKREGKATGPTSCNKCHAKKK